MSDVIVLSPVVEGTDQQQQCDQHQAVHHLVQSMTQHCAAYDKRSRSPAASSSPFLSTPTTAPPTPTAATSSASVAKLQFSRSYLGDTLLASFFDGIGLLHHSFEGNEKGLSLPPAPTTAATRLEEKAEEKDIEDVLVRTTSTAVLDKGWVRGVWADRYSDLAVIDATSCNLTPGCTPLLVGLIKHLPKLQSFFLGDNFRGNLGTERSITKGAKVTVVVEKSKFFCTSLKEDRRFTLNMTLIDPLLDIWRTHKHLFTLKLDPWLVSGHREWKEHTNTMRSKLRHEAFHARYHPAATNLGDGDGDGGGGPGGTTTTDLNGDPRRRARAISTVVYQTMPVPDRLVKAASVASGIGGPPGSSGGVQPNPQSILRDRLIQIQVSEGKDREKINGREVLAREKLRQTVRGRSNSTMPPDEQNPAIQGQQSQGEVQYTAAVAASSLASGVTTAAPSPSTGPTVQRQPKVDAAFVGLVALEDEIRLMLQQKEFDSRRKVVSRFHRR